MVQTPILTVTFRFIAAIGTVRNTIASPVQRNALPVGFARELVARTARCLARHRCVLVAHEGSILTFALLRAGLVLSNSDSCTLRVDLVVVRARATARFDALTLAVHHLPVRTEAAIDTARLGNATTIVIAFETGLRAAWTAGHVDFARIALHWTTISRAPFHRLGFDNGLAFAGEGTEHRADGLTITTVIGTRFVGEEIRGRYTRVERYLLARVIETSLIVFFDETGFHLVDTLLEGVIENAGLDLDQIALISCPCPSLLVFTRIAAWIAVLRLISAWDALR